MDAIPVWLFFAVALAVVMLGVEVGYRLGHAARRRSEDEKESPVSSISGAILALLAFVMAFTFAIVSDRYDARKALVRDEANAIGTAYLRADFLEEPARSATQELFRRYVDLLVAATQSGNLDRVREAVAETSAIQAELWAMAVENGRRDENSEVVALYVEALNAVIDIQALRVAIGLQARVPAAIWLALCALILLGMIAVGYQTAIAGSRRSGAAPILALSLSVVLTLILLLDRPENRFLTVSQQPLIDLQASMQAGPESR